MPRASNNLAFFPGKKLLPQEMQEIQQMRQNVAYALMKDEETREHFYALRASVNKYGARSSFTLGIQERLVLANMRLVFKMATNFANRGVQVSDLVQEGFIGLQIAIQRFNPDLGFKVSTYASWWVRTYMERAIHDTTSARAMRVPIHRQEAEVRLHREIASYETAFGSIPSDEELLEFLKAIKHPNPGSLKKIRDMRMQRNVGMAVSTETPLSHDGEGTLGDLFIAQAPRPETLVLARRRLPQLQAEINDIVNGEHVAFKSDRNNAIIRMRFGLDGSWEGHTLQEIGEVFKLTRERVRQIIARRLREEEVTEKEFKQMIENLQIILEALAAAS